MNRPKISILTPVFNGEKYMAVTLETIVNQTFTDWELILMDGGSTDNGLAIAREYAARYPNIRIYSEPDEGPYDAFHKGLKHAEGDFICMVCISDGYVNEQWLELCMESFNKDPELSLVWGIPMDMAEEGNITGPHFMYAHFLPEGSGRRFFKEIFRRATNPASLKRLLSKLNASSIQSAKHAMSTKEPPQKEAWFEYWLKTGSIFPDGNMCVAKPVFKECLLPYHKGTREAGDWMGWYFNFNSKGYLAHCIPVPANFGRLTPGNVSERVIEYDDGNKRRYFARLAELREQAARGDLKVVFKDRTGKALTEHA